MAEMTHVSEDHRDAVLVGGSNNFIIANGTARLDHTGDAHCRRSINAIAEREEGVGSHGGTLHLQSFVSGFDAGNFGRVNAAHLARANTDRHVVACIHNGVGFNEFRHFPAEQRVTQFLFGWLTLADNAQLAGIDHTKIAILNQQATVDAFEVETGHAALPLTAHQNADVLFGCGHAQCRFTGRWRNNDFHELTADDRLRGRFIQLTVKGDDAAERRGRIGFISALVGGKN